MATMTLQLPKIRQARLRRVAQARGITVDKLLDEFSAAGLAHYDTETRFRAVASKGSPARALELLDKVDAALARRR